jgi:hypothetical protein
LAWLSSKSGDTCWNLEHGGSSWKSKNYYSYFLLEKLELKIIKNEQVSILLKINVPFMFLFRDMRLHSITKINNWKVLKRYKFTNKYLMET